ncbi:MAG: 2,3-bisphosphoglycerate-independent phosphoglycerate mutase, partial [Luminiphilus sp.]|nr:2,3-bisphosphoglycerate-independent phosphoglycerate mutase [Luminiphilus sp.]
FSPTVLVILDGFGFREEPDNNAIFHANTPTFDRLWDQGESTLVAGSGLDVGLPDGLMGNSEVGHMSLGSGRIIYQSITRIDQAIKDGSFNTNTAYTATIDSAVSAGGAIHVMGLLSPGGVHSHEEHIFAALRLARARGATRIYLHAFLDGRDMPPRSAAPSLKRADQVFEELGVGRVATVQGRYFAMDRDNRWSRMEPAYRLITQGESLYHSESTAGALAAAYSRDENDEFVSPTKIGSTVEMADGDAVLFMNFRADRARQLTQALTETSFAGFQRQSVPKIRLVATTEYYEAVNAKVAFEPDVISDTLGEVVAAKGLRQARIAETEKYAHVTFFFSGGRERLFTGEERILIPSPDVATYDLQPEMSADQVTDAIITSLKTGSHELIVVNFANGDMVGHTGDFQAAVTAVETLDRCIARVEDAVLAAGGQALITADHGNCEQMHDHTTEQPHTQHTTRPVPLFYIGHEARHFAASPGVLADIAPTVLDLMQIVKPDAMTGSSLLTR